AFRASPAARIHNGKHVAVLREVGPALVVAVADVGSQFENHRQRVFLFVRTIDRGIQPDSIPHRNLDSPGQVKGLGGLSFLLFRKNQVGTKNVGKKNNDATKSRSAGRAAQDIHEAPRERASVAESHSCAKAGSHEKGGRKAAYLKTIHYPLATAPKQ